MPQKQTRQRPVQSKNATRTPKTSRTPKASRTSEGQSDESQPRDNSDLHKLFVDELADTLHAEHQLLKALPKLIKAAGTPELGEALQDHFAETEEHVERLEQVFSSLSEKSRKKRCEGMEGIIAEGDEMVAEQKKSSALDAAIIAAGQKAEHYEIASYGTLIAWAKQMGHDEAVDLLEQTLEEEKAADQKLTEIAESLANAAADSAD
jgi:ferritin-like metal-binding protein YciE